MKIFLCGQRSFGKEVCRALLDAGHEIVGVAPAPPQKHQDKLYGYAAVKGLPLVTDCKSLVSSAIPSGTELIVAAHSHWLISGQCLERAKFGGIGFHPSLLPRHRGKDAVRWAVHMGDYVSGGTVYRLTDKTDGGDILRQELVWIKPGWTYHELWRAIFPVGVRLLVDAVQDLERGGRAVGGARRELRHLGAILGPAQVGAAGVACPGRRGPGGVRVGHTERVHGVHPGLYLVYLQHSGPRDLS